jgi:altronate dehydratase
MLNEAIMIDHRDNVVTALKHLKKGQIINIGGSAVAASIISLETICAGHKLAVRDIKKGQIITKYGESIGLATLDIPAGSHVHVHNVEGRRGRGDLM